MDYFLYVDEAGCPGALPSSTSNVQPVFCLSGLIIPVNRIKRLTADLLEIKEKFYPTVYTGLNHDLQLLLHEIKGSELKKDITRRGRNQRRRAIGILNKVLALLDVSQVKILARIYIKEPGGNFDGNAVYTSSIQLFCAHFQHFLTSQNNVARGMVVLDSRRHGENSKVSFSVSTQKYSVHGDPYQNLIEAPLFGHSENSAGLQLADLIASAVMIPLAIHTYCKGHVFNLHTKYDFEIFKQKFGTKIKNLQYRYEKNGKFKGGVIVRDGILKSRSASRIFK